MGPLLWSSHGDLSISQCSIDMDQVVWGQFARVKHTRVALAAGALQDSPNRACQEQPQRVGLFRRQNEARNRQASAARLHRANEGRTLFEGTGNSPVSGRLRRLDEEKKHVVRNCFGTTAQILNKSGNDHLLPL